MDKLFWTLSFAPHIWDLQWDAYSIRFEFHSWHVITTSSIHLAQQIHSLKLKVQTTSCSFSQKPWFLLKLPRLNLVTGIWFSTFSPFSWLLVFRPARAPEAELKVI